jgi:hypothetical protein
MLCQPVWLVISVGAGCTALVLYVARRGRGDSTPGCQGTDWAAFPSVHYEVRTHSC